MRSAGGSWERTKTTVQFQCYTAETSTFFDTLIAESFKIDRNGLIHFAGLGEPTQNLQHAAILQGALLGSFLQHGRTRKADKAAEPKGNLLVEIDEQNLPLRYRRVERYPVR